MTGHPRDVTPEVTYSAATRSEGWVPPASALPLRVCGAASSGLPRTGFSNSAVIFLVKTAVLSASACVSKAASRMASRIQSCWVWTKSAGLRHSHIFLRDRDQVSNASCWRLIQSAIAASMTEKTWLWAASCGRRVDQGDGAEIHDRP